MGDIWQEGEQEIKRMLDQLRSGSAASEACFTSAVDKPHGDYEQTVRRLIGYLGICWKGLKAPGLEFLLLGRPMMTTASSPRPYPSPLEYLGSQGQARLASRGVLVNQIGALGVLSKRDGTQAVLQQSLGNAAWNIVPAAVSFERASLNSTKGIMAALGRGKEADGSPLMIRPGSRWIIKAKNSGAAFGIKTWTAPDDGPMAPSLRRAAFASAPDGAVMMQRLVWDPVTFHGRKLNSRNLLLLLPPSPDSSATRLFYDAGTIMISPQVLDTKSGSGVVVNTANAALSGSKKDEDIFLSPPAPGQNATKKLAHYIARTDGALSNEGLQRWRLSMPSHGNAVEAAYRYELAAAMRQLRGGLHPLVRDAPRGQFAFMGADYVLERSGKLWLLEINLFPVMPTHAEGSARMAYYRGKWAEALKLVGAWKWGSPLPTHELREFAEA